MLLGNTIQALVKLARVALAALLLVVVPMADAFACGGEKSPASLTTETAATVSTEIAFGASHEHGGQPAGDAQHCVHGHCHHGTPFRSDASETHVIVTVSASITPHVQTVILTRVPGGLERPPKA